MFARRLKGLYRTRRPCVKSLLSPGGSTGPRNVNVVQYNPDHCQQSVSAFHFQLVIHSQSASGTLYSKYVGLLFATDLAQNTPLLCIITHEELITFRPFGDLKKNNTSFCFLLLFSVLNSISGFTT